MKFDELWEQVNQFRVLSDAAIRQVPYVLHDDTKKKLTRKTAKEVLIILQEAIDEINGGSVETVDALVRKQL